MLDVVETQRLGGRDGGRRELHASSARRFQDSTLVGKHSVELVTDHPTNVFGDGDVDEVSALCNFPAPTALDQSGAPHEVFRDIDDEQRITSGAPMNHLGQL